MTNVDYAARAVAALFDLREVRMEDPRTPEAIVMDHVVLVALRAAQTMHKYAASAAGLPIDPVSLARQVQRWPGSAGYGADYAPVETPATW